MTEVSVVYTTVDANGVDKTFTINDVKPDAEPDDVVSVGSKIASFVPGDLSGAKRVDKITTTYDVD